ncbi:MAG: folate-binding protein [Desertifilum sp.]|nr:folate-binding protein [Desertifilum sp.]
MIDQLQQVQAATGATLKDGVAVRFENETDASLEDDTLLCDRTHWGRLQVSGADRIRFLHNQSTNDFEKLKPGQGCDTVFVTSTARTLDLATAYVTEDSVILLVSPNRREKIFQWCDRYIFPMDKVELTDITEETACFSLIGKTSDAILIQLGGQPLTGEPTGTHQLQLLANLETRVAVGSGLATPGYTLIVPAQKAATLWSQLVAAGVKPIGSQTWETLRIQQGRPTPDQELTEEYNPLEAGLWQTISFEKGCYIGQETIARLNTYKGVKQQLWGVRLKTYAEPGSLITAGEEKVGTLTSIMQTDKDYIGLAYIRTKAGGAGLQVKVNDTLGEVIDVPFLSRGYLGEAPTA